MQEREDIEGNAEVKAAGAQEDAEMHVAVCRLRRIVQARENEAHGRKVEILVTWSFWDRQENVRREEFEDISGLLVGLSAVEVDDWSVRQVHQ